MYSDSTMSQEQQMNDMLEILVHLKDNMVTRDDLDSKLERYLGRNEFDQKIDKLKSDLMTHMDGFIVLHQKLEIELVALRSKYDRLESYIEQLARHAQIVLQ